MKQLMDLKNEIIQNNLSTLYIFTGDEYMIKRIYYEEIARRYGKLRRFDNVQGIYNELEKKSLFSIKSVFICYNDLEYLKQKQKHYERLINLSKNNIVILIYEQIPEKSIFRKTFEDYITLFNKVTEDIALKYVNKQSKFEVDDDFAKRIVFNCDRSYGAIIEEMNKYNHYKQSNTDSILDDKTYSSIFCDKKVVITPKQFADAFIQRNTIQIAEYIKILEDQNLLGYIPELYNTIIIALFIKLYGKWDGGTKAYQAGEYWGRIKEVRDYYIPYNKDDLLDIRWLLYKLDLDLRRGKMKSEYAWNYLIGVIL